MTQLLLSLLHVRYQQNCFPYCSSHGSSMPEVLLSSWFVLGFVACKAFRNSAKFSTMGTVPDSGTQCCLHQKQDVPASPRHDKFLGVCSGNLPWRTHKLHGDELQATAPKVQQRKTEKASAFGERCLPEQWSSLLRCNHELWAQLRWIMQLMPGLPQHGDRHSFAEDMSMVLAAFARLRLRDREMMLRVAEATPAILGQFSATDITSLCLHCSRMLLPSTCSGSCFAPTYVAGKGCYHIGLVLEALAVSIEARGISSQHFPDWTWSTGLSSTSLQGRLRGAPFRSDVCHLQLFESLVLKYWEWAEA